MHLHLWPETSNSLLKHVMFILINCILCMEMISAPDYYITMTAVWEEWPFTIEEALQHCHPCSCSHFKSKQEFFGTNLWLSSHQMQSVVATNHPPSEAFFPPLNDWASVMSCQLWLGLPAEQTLMSVGLSDLWVIGHRAHFVTSTRAFLYGHRLTWKRETWSGRGRLWEFGRTVRKKCGLSAQLSTITCAHTYLLCIVTCAARAPPATCCSSRGLFLSWEDACHCREIQQSFSPKSSSKLHFWWDFTGLKCHLNYGDPENCGEPGSEISMVMTIVITWCCHQGGRLNLQLLQLKKKLQLIKLAVR